VKLKVANLPINTTIDCYKKIPLRILLCPALAPRGQMGRRRIRPHQFILWPHQLNKMGKKSKKTENLIIVDWHGRKFTV
jgi:hypothetical protein